MHQKAHSFYVHTRGPGLIDITDEIAAWVAAATAGVGRGDGLLTLLSQHTSASLTIQENASADVRVDLESAFQRLAPRTAPYLHGLEGPDDMPAHIRTVLSGVHLAAPIQGGRLKLGRWQGVFLWEHRDQPHRREVAAHLLFS